MPELMAIVCDCEACVAWPSELAVSLLSVFGGNAPPSRLIASWIFVSLVSRARAAERTRTSGFPAILASWEWRVAISRPAENILFLEGAGLQCAFSKHGR